MSKTALLIADSLRKMRNELVTKFEDALKAIDRKIESERREVADDYPKVGKRRPISRGGPAQQPTGFS